MSKAQDLPGGRPGVRAWGGLAALLLIATAVPVDAHHNTAGQIQLLDDVDPMPRWHSTVLEWGEMQTISGHMTIVDPLGDRFVRGGRGDMWGRAIVFEKQVEGEWRWFFAITGHAAAIGSSQAEVTLSGPLDLEFEHDARLRFEDGNNTFAWSVTVGPGRYRVTTWAAGEIEGGLYAAPLWGTAGVELLAHTEGDDVRWIRADDIANVSAGATAMDNGLWARALATWTEQFDDLAYVSDNIFTNSGRVCLCRYDGPAEGWNGIPTTDFVPTFGGPSGTYQLDVIASSNRRAVDPLRPPSVCCSYNDALSWTLADVRPPDV